MTKPLATQPTIQVLERMFSLLDVLASAQVGSTPSARWAASTAHCILNDLGSAVSIAQVGSRRLPCSNSATWSSAARRARRGDRDACANHHQPVNRSMPGRPGARSARAVCAGAPHLTSVGNSPGPGRHARARRHAHAQRRPELAALERELAKVRRDGIARDDEELEVGVRCMAAGIHDDQDKLVAGLSISAPADRLEEAWVDRLKQVAAQISATLGHRG
jgi:hypothetical protein